MYALEFEAAIQGKNLTLPTHVANKVHRGQNVRVIMLLDEPQSLNAEAIPTQNISQAISAKKIKPFPVTQVEAGIGCVAYQGEHKSLEDMQQGIHAEAKRQWQRAITK